METLEAWHRADKALGTPEMLRLVQTVAQNTEHSVMMRIRGGQDPSGKLDIEMDVANSHLLPSRLWDAPYQPWQTVHFSEAFL